ncbi:MAG: HTTM domain-containing protein [Acidimicrobiales bacterium]
MSAVTVHRATSGGGWSVPFERVGDLRAMAVLRILLGPITLLHLAPFLRDARAGVEYDDHFWEPYLRGAPSPPGWLWSAALVVGAASAVLMMLGVLTRLTTSVTFVVVAGNLLTSQVHFRHNRAFLAILLGGLALLPAGRVLSVDAWWRRVRGAPTLLPTEPTWPLLLLRTQVSLVYLSSGISKLVDPDWLSGLVLWDRVVRYQHELEPLPGWAVDVLTWRSLYWLVAPAAILIELSLGVGLWFARTRLAALWVAIAFHLSIEVSAKVEVFSYGAIAGLVIWVTPAARDRVVRLRRDDPAARALATAVRWLDWFGRFRVEPAGRDDPAVTVVDRDGRTLSGRAASRLVLTRLPVTFPVAALMSAEGRGRPAEPRSP